MGWAGRLLLGVGVGVIGVSGCTGQISPGPAGPGADDAPFGGDAPGAGPAADPIGPAGGAAGSGAGDPGADPPDEAYPRTAPARFACDPGAPLAAVRFRRLSQRQYASTLSDLLRIGLGDDALAGEVLSALAATRDALPDDVRKSVAEDLHGTYRRLDQDVAQAHVDGWFELARRAGRELSQPARLRALAGDCALDGDGGNEAACVEGLLSGFGARALRRPLDADELGFYAGYYGDLGVEDPAGYADVIAGLLSAPQFLYLIEHGTDAAGGTADVVALDAFELASRLSYHLWETLPDDALWAAAVDDSLLDPDVYRAQVDRLFEDPRTATTLREFFRDWLKLEEVPDPAQHLDSPLYQAFAGEDLPTAELRGHMQDEVLDLLSHLTWDDPQGFDELLTTEASFARDDDLARIYGVPAWDGEGEPPSLPAGERPGLLTRAAFLVGSSANTRPIMKGLFIRRNMLCDTLPPPPNNAANVPPEPSETASTREVVEGLTEQRGTACASCHAMLINPLGFATEGFDALGRARSEQRLFSEDGRELGAVPIDTRSTPRVFGDDARESSGPADLMRLVQESGKAHACFARHYFRFSFGRMEDLRQDGCALERLRTALVEAGSLAGMLREVALAPEFRERSFVEAP